MGLMKELNDLNAIYLKMHEQQVSEDQDKGYVVTRADKKGNTPAWQGYKSGKKNVKTGKPLYKAAAHLKKEEVLVVDEGIGDMAIKAIEKTNPPYISKRSSMIRDIKLKQLKSYLKKQDDKKKKAASKD